MTTKFFLFFCKLLYSAPFADAPKQILSSHLSSEVTIIKQNPPVRNLISVQLQLLCQGLIGLLKNISEQKASRRPWSGTSNMSTIKGQRLLKQGALNCSQLNNQYIFITLLKKKLQSVVAGQ